MRAVLVVVLLCMASFGQEDNQIEETTIELCENTTDGSCEAFNNSEFSTAPAITETTSSMIKTTTTKKPKTTTSKISVKKSSPTNTTKTPLNPDPDCVCDTTKGGCEVNCCCDVDCSSDQRAVFSHCEVSHTTALTDYCVSPLLLHHNNTDHHTVLTDRGALCVIYRNTEASTDFQDVPVIKTVASFEKKLGQRKYFSWSNPLLPDPKFNTDTPYTSSSPIWITDNVTISYLELPGAAGYSTLCHSTIMPRFLKDTETSCTVPLANKADCLALKVDYFNVISSPHNLNFSGPQECTEDVCLPVRYFLCAGNCTEMKIPPVTFDKLSNTCNNIIESIEYKMFHNGTQGIIDVKALCILKNISVYDDQVFRRRYRVFFEWVNANNVSILKRSGHPGYESGKPVISGRKTQKSVVFNTSSSEWISVSVAGTLGHCTSRYNIQFKENVWSQCLLKVSGTCEEIQGQIWHQLLGPAANTSGVVISSYGDPRVGKGEEDAWVPLLTSGSHSLPDIVSAVELILLYSLVGPIAKPQTKIIGAYLITLPPSLTCKKDITSVSVQMSVRFVDKTVPAVTKFAPPPVYEIKLPRDFFYPFLSAGKQNFVRKEIILFFSIFQIYYNYRHYD